MVRERKNREAGHEVETIWEQDFDILITSQDVQNILKDFGYTEPLIPRDAYYGRRTGACKPYHKDVNGEKIQYYDVTSLYPFVMYAKEFPKGKPEPAIITDPEDQDISSYFGIGKVTVLPPQSLYHPVLTL